jgi:hypothetical protein
VGATYQKAPCHLIALPGDPLARITLARLVLARNETKIGSHAAALFEPPWILQGQDKGKGCQWPHSRNLPEQLGLLWVMLFA